MTLGGAAQVAAAHCPNERTLDPQSAASQTHLCPSQLHYGIHPAMFKALNGFLCADVPLRNYSLTHILFKTG